MNIKLVVIFALFLFCCLVNSDASITSVENYEVVEVSSNITGRGWPGFFILVGAIAFATVAIINAGKCSEKGGCYKGYCWAYCGLSLSNGDWCYTTKSYSQSFQYVRCIDDSECDLCWKCAGSCTL